MLCVFHLISIHTYPPHPPECCVSHLISIHSYPPHLLVYSPYHPILLILTLPFSLCHVLGLSIFHVLCLAHPIFHCSFMYSVCPPQFSIFYALCLSTQLQLIVGRLRTRNGHGSLTTRPPHHTVIFFYGSYSVFILTLSSSSSCTLSVSPNFFLFCKVILPMEEGNCTTCTWRIHPSIHSTQSIHSVNLHILQPFKTA